MMRFRPWGVAAALVGGLAGGALAQETHEVRKPERTSWSFAGPFGSYDQAQLQRGFQVFREVCSTCHSARLLAFRNLADPGGPHFSESQVKALAAGVPGDGRAGRRRQDV